MRDEPNIATVAALIGDTARAAMLTALVDSRALPAGELAAAAGLSPPAASVHLAGPLGAQVLRRCCDLGWLTRIPGSRAVQLTHPGRDSLREQLGIGVS